MRKYFMAGFETVLNATAPLFAIANPTMLLFALAVGAYLVGISAAHAFDFYPPHPV
jgi:hypothetical protein